MVPTYVTMAWMVLVHSHGGSEMPATTVHTHHAGGGPAPALAIAWLLTVILTIQAITSTRRREFWLALESVAMAAMLVSMLIPFLGVQ